MNKANILKATALIATGFALGRITTNQREVTEYTPVRLHEDGMVSIWDENGESEMINVFYDSIGRICTEFVFSNLQINEAYNVPMTGRERVEKTTLKVRNDHHTIDLYTRGLMDDTNDDPSFLFNEEMGDWEDEENLIPLDGFGDDPWYDDLFTDEEIALAADANGREGIMLSHRRSDDEYTKAAE